MDKHLVLIKFFEISEKLRKDKERNCVDNGYESSISENLGKVTITGRNILRLLKENNNVNQRTIAKSLNISSQAISENLKRLEQFGYIQRISGTQNNENIIVLTETGQKIAIFLDQRIREHSEQVLKNLTSDEIESLYNILRKLLD